MRTINLNEASNKSLKQDQTKSRRCSDHSLSPKASKKNMMARKSVLMVTQNDGTTHHQLALKNKSHSHDSDPEQTGPTLTKNQRATKGGSSLGANNIDEDFNRPLINTSPDVPKVIPIKGQEIISPVSKPDRRMPDINLNASINGKQQLTQNPRHASISVNEWAGEPAR